MTTKWAPTLGALLATPLLLALPVMARADDGQVLEELERLRNRVDELETWKADRVADDASAARETDSELGRAIREWLDANREDETLFGGNVYAPKSTRIRLGGMVRVRMEKQHNSYTFADRQGNDTNDIFLGRVRLNAQVDVREDLSARVEIQDARPWGTEAGAASNSGNVDLSEVTDETFVKPLDPALLAERTRRLVRSGRRPGLN